MAEERCRSNRTLVLDNKKFCGLKPSFTLLLIYGMNAVVSHLFLYFHTVSSSSGYRKFLKELLFLFAMTSDHELSIIDRDSSVLMFKNFFEFFEELKRVYKS